MAKSPIQVEVKARNNEPYERLIRRFVKKVKKEGVQEEVRERRYYEKPSTKRRKERIRRKRLAQRAQEKNNNR